MRSLRMYPAQARARVVIARRVLLMGPLNQLLVYHEESEGDRPARPERRALLAGALRDRYLHMDRGDVGSKPSRKSLRVQRSPPRLPLGSLLTRWGVRLPARLHWIGWPV